MNCIIQKYSTSILLAFVMLLVVSCQKGGEPIPNFESNDTVSQASEITADQRLGDGDDGNDEEYAPESGGDDDDDGGKRR